MKISEDWSHEDKKWSENVTKVIEVQLCYANNLSKLFDKYEINDRKNWMRFSTSQANIVHLQYFFTIEKIRVNDRKIRIWNSRYLQFLGIWTWLYAWMTGCMIGIITNCYYIGCRWQIKGTSWHAFWLSHKEIFSCPNATREKWQEQLNASHEYVHV